MGKLAAAEVPRIDYTVSLVVDDFRPILDLCDQLRTPAPMLSLQMLNEASLNAWLILGQLSWFEPSKGARQEWSQLVLPTLSDEPESRGAFFRRFRPPTAFVPYKILRQFQYVSRYRHLFDGDADRISSDDPDFDRFFRGRVRYYDDHAEVEQLWFAEGSEKASKTTPPFVEGLRVDRYAIGVYQAFKVAATELSRRPTVSSPDVCELYNYAMWYTYLQLLVTVKEYFDCKGDGATVDNLTLAYGRFMSVVMMASGRREVQGLRWTLLRELPRWELSADVRSRRIGERIWSVAGRAAQQVEKGGEAPEDSALYRTCVGTCREYNCHANWDPTQLFTGDSKEKLDLLGRVIITALNHIHGPGEFDRVVGIAMGGVAPAAGIALVLRKPLSILYEDNVMNLVPQPAVAERWFLIDDAYQTGYSYQSIWSQMIGMKPAPPPENMFVLFKARHRRDTVAVNSFKLTEFMEEVRHSIGWATEYEYSNGESDGGVARRYGHYPIPTSDKTGAIDSVSVDNMVKLIKERVLESRECVADPARKDTFEKARNLIAQEAFIKLELLYDHPDLVLAIGYEIYKRRYSDDLLAYVAGSFKVVPFLVAANLHAMCDGVGDVPLIVTSGRGELQYQEILAGESKKRGRTKLAYVDVSRRTGETYQKIMELVEMFCGNTEEEIGWGAPPLVFVDLWPERHPSVRFDRIFEDMAVD
ncbi:MAG: hypothetical protein ABSH14_11710 [Verrucomicrobiia bacterium]|jgi:hypothetical protein